MENKETEIGLKDKIIKLIQQIETEPITIGEPGESVQLGRLQVCDELKILLNCGIQEKRR